VADDAAGRITQDNAAELSRQPVANQHQGRVDTAAEVPYEQGNALAVNGGRRSRTDTRIE